MHLGEIIGMAESKGYFYRFPAETRRRNSWIVSMKNDGRMHTEYFYYHNVNNVTEIAITPDTYAHSLFVSEVFCECVCVYIYIYIYIYI